MNHLKSLKFLKTLNLRRFFKNFKWIRRVTNDSVPGRRTWITLWRTTRSVQRAKDSTSIQWRSCWSVTCVSSTSTASMPISFTRRVTLVRRPLFLAPTATCSSRHWSCCGSTPTTFTPMPCTLATSAIRSSLTRPRSALMPSYTSMSTLFRLNQRCLSMNSVLSIFIWIFTVFDVFFSTDF